MPIIAGVDEVGRGPLAGPVVAAAVILEDNALLSKLKDSKVLTEKAREKFYTQITETGIWCVALASVEEIDEINILQASLLAMQRAVLGLSTAPTEAWIDGPHAPKLPCKAKCYIQGDALYPVISAASIIAKVTRDRMMVELSETYPEYGFERHKGYPTAQHIQAMKSFGITPIHRRSYKPVRDLMVPHVV
jgi:ribonuclease HII